MNGNLKLNGNLVAELMFRFGGGGLESIPDTFGKATLCDVYRLLGAIASEGGPEANRITPSENSRVVELLESLDRGPRYMDYVKSDETRAYYVVFVFGDVEPHLYGPYATPEDRDQKARKIRALEGEDGGIYWLTKDANGAIEIGPYAGDFFGDSD